MTENNNRESKPAEEMSPISSATDTTNTIFDQLKFVLVGTSHPGNVGASCRAMWTMGFGQLDFVSPRCDYLDPVAVARASHSQHILHKAKSHSQLLDAVSDCHYVVGTSARKREIGPKVQPPTAVAAELVRRMRKGERVALVFGREDVGLSNKELGLCQTHAYIPTADSYGSLNVAMALQIFSYEVRRELLATESIGATGAELSQIDRPNDQDLGSKKAVPPATAAEVEVLIEHMEKVLGDVGFYGRAPVRQVPVRLGRMFRRLAPDKREIGILRGFLARVEALIDRDEKSE